MKFYVVPTRLLPTVISVLCLWCGAAVFASAPLPPTAAQALGSIGKPDGHSIEFAPDSRSKVMQEPGKTVLSRDFPGDHSGSVGFDGTTSEKPDTITFDLKVPPSGSDQLVLGLIYKSGAPRQTDVMVNRESGK